MRPGKVALSSFDFERPSVSLLVDAALLREHDLAEEEQFDYQGDYGARGDGQHLADNRIDELHSAHEQITGSTNAQGLAAGHLFDLSRHPRDDQNTRYLCVQTDVAARLCGWTWFASGRRP